jgi:hypothetical protein
MGDGGADYEPAVSTFPGCILGPLLNDVLRENEYPTTACVIEPDDSVRGRLVTELADAGAMQGAMVISADPAYPGLSRYAMPEKAAYREFMAIASDPGRQRPILLIAPQDLPAAILRDIRKYKAAGVAVSSPTRGGHSTADVPPDEFSLLWHERQLTATANSTARLLGVAPANAASAGSSAWTGSLRGGEWPTAAEIDE